MSMLEELKGLGVNVEEGLKRLGGNEPFYERMLGKFTEMIKDSSIQPDFDSTDYAEMIEKAHALKGAAGNLSISPLYEAYTEIVDLLRGGQPEQAKEVLVKTIPVQEKIIDCIEQHM